LRARFCGWHKYGREQQILLVDDDKDLREMVANALRLRAYTVAAVADGKHALTRLQDEEFDAGITDVNLSGMSGVDLCAGVSGVRPGLPVIAAEPEDLRGLLVPPGTA
jgi:DNA-binding NtrC family response regulator